MRLRIRFIRLRILLAILVPLRRAAMRFDRWAIATMLRAINGA